MVAEALPKSSASVATEHVRKHAECFSPSTISQLFGFFLKKIPDFTEAILKKMCMFLAFFFFALKLWQRMKIKKQLKLEGSSLS